MKMKNRNERNWKSESYIENWEKLVKFWHCLEPTARELKWALGAANIQSHKERIRKMVKTESNFEKGDSKFYENEEKIC